VEIEVPGFKSETTISAGVSSSVASTFETTVELKEDKMVGASCDRGNDVYTVLWEWIIEGSNSDGPVGIAKS
jgi:hypothetical protein